MTINNFFPDRVPSPNPEYPQHNQAKEMYNYGDLQEGTRYPENRTYQTLPSKRTQFFHPIDVINLERSVTPDITRGLDKKTTYFNYEETLNQSLGIPIRIPDVRYASRKNVPYDSTETDQMRLKEKPNQSNLPHISPQKLNDSIKISPIDPRHLRGGFKSSTPCSSKNDLKSAVNLESLLSPKKSTMSNEELYAVIHKSKKKLNIKTEDQVSSTIAETEPEKPMCRAKSPETGYIGDRSKSRLSWSPSKGEYVDFNPGIDNLSPDSRSRQSWACNDNRKRNQQTSRMDFKKLLSQKSHVLTGTSPKNKLSAVEQLKLSKQQPQTPPKMDILELSGSPRSLVQRKYAQVDNKAKPVQKIMSPRSQWRFANPRSDVLSSTILEDCREDESPNSSGEKNFNLKNRSKENRKNDVLSTNFSDDSSSKPNSSISQRLQVQRAQFFNSTPPSGSQFKNEQRSSFPPTLETAF